MTEELWHKHTPGDPMPCKCGDSVVEIKFRGYVGGVAPARYFDWGKIKDNLAAEITDWRFIERKGDDVIAADPYDVLEWDEDSIATVVLKKLGRPEWVRDDDLVRFSRDQGFVPARNWSWSWGNGVAFQIKRRPALTPAVPQLLKMLSVATDDEAAAIRSAARRANIEVPE